MGLVLPVLAASVIFNEAACFVRREKVADEEETLPTNTCSKELLSHVGLEVPHERTPKITQNIKNNLWDWKENWLINLCFQI